MDEKHGSVTTLSAYMHSLNNKHNNHVLCTMYIAFTLSLIDLSKE